MKILFTGATGFLGRNLFKPPFFLNHEIAVVVRDTNKEHLYRNFLPAEIRLVSVSDIQSGASNFYPELFIHAATDYGRTGFTSRVIDANITLPMSILEKSASDLVGIVYFDTYYNKIDYHYPWLLDYSISKFFFHKWIVEKYPYLLKVRIFLEHVYGRHDRQDKFIPEAIKALTRGDSYSLTNGHQMRDFTFVDDVVEGTWRVADWVEKNHEITVSKLQAFEFGTGTPTSVAGLVGLINAIIGNEPSRIKLADLPMREKEIMQSVANLTSLEPLGWRPTTSLEVGLRKTVQGCDEGCCRS